MLSGAMDRNHVCFPFLTHSLMRSVNLIVGEMDVGNG